MANRKKPESKKVATVINIRVTADFKARLDKMANETGVSTSERARTCLDRIVSDWENQ